MRFTSALVALSAVCAASASLVNRQSLPNCAAPCLTGSNVNYGGCSPQDNSCLCKSQTFIQSSTACIQAACTGSDLASAESFAQAICAAVGVTLTAPSGSATATAPSTATSASASPSASHSSGALSHGANAFAGIAAVGLAALVL